MNMKEDKTIKKKNFKFILGFLMAIAILSVSIVFAFYEKADKEELTKVINEQFKDEKRTEKKVNEDDFTTESFKDYSEVIDAAIEIEKDRKAEQDVVDKAVQDIARVKAKLVKLLPPAIPDALKANLLSYSSNEITWNPSENAVGYELYLSLVEDGEYEKIAELTEAKYLHENLTIGTEYFYKVRSLNSDGTKNKYSEYSDVLVAKSILLVPTHFTLSPKNYNTIELSWGLVDGAKGYEVHTSNTKDGSYSMKSDSSVSKSEVRDLIPGKTYYYKIRAYAEVNSQKVYSDFTESKHIKVILSKPKNVINSRSGKEDVKLSWAKVEGATAYEVHRATKQKGSYSEIGNLTTNTYIDTNALTDHIYYYKVRAYVTVENKKIYSDWSDIKKVENLRDDSHIGNISQNLYNYLSSEGNRSSIRTTVIARNGNRGESNACVLTVAEALRRIGLSFPLDTDNIDELIPLLRGKSWKKDSNYENLKLGDICFSTDAKGNKSGRPTHAYVFMGWVENGNYDYAYIFDNQSKYYGGKTLHIRNIKNMEVVDGSQKEPFSFFMYKR